MSELVKITKFHMIGEDDRGIAASFCLPRKQDEFIYFTRKAGSLSGNTYHEGKAQATNPKVFILLSGKINFSYRKIGEENKFSEFVVAPALIEVLPLVTHKIEALEDFTMLECNSIQDIQNDRIKEEV